MLRYRDAFCASCTTWKIRGPAAAVSVDALIHNAPVYAVVDCECRLTITSTTLAKDATERGGNCRETARRAGLVETLLSFACLQLLFCFLRFCNRSLFFLSLVSGSKKQVQYHVAWLPWLGSLRACYGWVTWHRRFPRVPCFPSCPPCWACSMLRLFGRLPSLCQQRAAGCCCDLPPGFGLGRSSTCMWAACPCKCASPCCRGRPTGFKVRTVSRD